MQTGDLDFDCDVDAEDFGWFLTAYGRCAGDEGYVAEADMNLDQCIGLADYQLWLSRYRAFIGEPAAPPPAAIFPLQPGDVNRDGHVMLDDVGGLVNVLLGADNDPHHAEAADVDGSGALDGRDVAAFVAALTAD